MEKEKEISYEDFLESLVKDIDIGPTENDLQSNYITYKKIRKLPTIQKGTKLFAALDLPGLTAPYEVIEGDPLNKTCNKIMIREMKTTYSPDGTLCSVNPEQSNCLIEAVRCGKLFKSSMGFHYITPTPLYKI